MAINNQKSEIVLGLVFFLVYLSTCLPSVLPADNGEFQLVAWKLGIAHPPGYALYTIIGWLFSSLSSSPTFELNLLSAILASIALIVVSRTVRQLTKSTLASMLAAALLGTSTTFWAQATTANIRMPTALFTALCVSVLVRWSSSRGDQGLGIRDQATAQRVIPSSFHLVILSFVFSLGLGHHLSLAFPGVFFIVYLVLNDRTLIRQPRRWVAPLLAFALGLLILLYFPLRGATGGTLADGETTAYLAQPDKWLDHILGRGFEGDFFYFINTRSDLLLDRVALLPTLFTFQFNPFVIMLVLIGAVRLIRNDWKLAVMLIGGSVLHTFVAITYRAPQTVEYLLPAYVLLAIMIGYGLGGLQITRHSSLVTNVLRVACWVSIVLQLANNLPSFQWLRQNEDTRDYAESLLNDAPANALILSNWHWAAPMWYLQQVEGVRPDVEVQYVYPRGESLAQSYLNAIDAGLKTNRPVITDMFFRTEFNASPYFFAPLSAEAYQVCATPCPLEQNSLGAVEADFAGRFRLTGYNLSRLTFTPGEAVKVQLAYRVEQTPDRDYSFFVHLVDGEGRVIGQADQTIATTRYTPSDNLALRFSLAPLTSVPPGKYTLMAGIYAVEAGRVLPLKSGDFERVTVAAVQVQADERLIKVPGIDLAGGITFVGASASIKDTLHPGDRLTLDLTFAATRPILRDYVVSVQLTGQGWRVSDDSVPALGAIPTLKWIAGSQITDRHVLTIPADAAPGPATISLIVYDAFTQEPLALLDAELIKQGQSIPIGTWNVVK